MWTLILLAILFYYLIWGRRNMMATQEIIVREDMKPYYKTINAICFKVSIASAMVGFLLTLAMIWEIFPNNDVIEKSWLSLGAFFGTAVIVGIVNNAFSLQIVSKDRSESE